MVVKCWWTSGHRAMPSACAGVMQDLAKCIAESKCIKVSVGRVGGELRGCPTVYGRNGRENFACSSLASLPWVARTPQEEKRSIEECVKRVDECNALRYTYAECKRGQVNMRSRIQGSKGY